MRLSYPFFSLELVFFHVAKDIAKLVGELSVSFHGYNNFNNIGVICSVQVGWNPAAEPSGFGTLF